MKVTSKLVGNTPTQEIDWNRPQLLRFEDKLTWFIILTNGKNNGDNFSGTCVSVGNSKYELGEYSHLWAKSNVLFTLVESHQQVILQNNPDEL